MHVHLTAAPAELHKLTVLVTYLRGNKKEQKHYEAIKRKASRLYWQDEAKYRVFKGKYLSKLSKRALSHNK